MEIGLSHRGTQAEDVPEQGAGKYIWTYERRGKRSGLEHIKRSSTISHFAKYYSDDQTKKGWAGHVARMLDRRGACRVLVWRPDGQKPLGRSGRKWENNVKNRSQLSGMASYGLDTSASDKGNLAGACRYCNFLTN